MPSETNSIDGLLARFLQMPWQHALGYTIIICVLFLNAPKIAAFISNTALPFVFGLARRTASAAKGGASSPAPVASVVPLATAIPLAEVQAIFAHAVITGNRELLSKVVELSALLQTPKEPAV